MALAGYQEMFDRLPAPLGVDDRPMLQAVRVLEAVVRGTAGEAFGTDERTRRYLEEDEFLVRRRILRDADEAIKSAGLG